jgi:serine/arginine repetitive matrix protein 1
MLTLVQPDIKNIQYQLTGFLEADAAIFCKELWKLLLSAQSSPQGVPKELLEAKKAELIQEKVCPVGIGVGWQC